MLNSEIKKYKSKINAFISFFLCLMIILFPMFTYGNTTAGHSSSNLKGLGWVAYDNEWIYYISSENEICKMKADGTEKSCIKKKDGSWMYDLNVVDDWIYYIKSIFKKNGSYYSRIYKIRTNGKDNQQVISTNITDIMLEISDGYMYYITDNTYKLYKRALNGKNGKKLVGSDCVLDFSVVGNWVYYIGEKGIYKIKTNGESKYCIKKDKYAYDNLQIKNGWIYYATNNLSLYRMKLNGSNKKKIASNVLACNVQDDYIYYSVRYKGLYRIKSNLSSKKRLTKIDSLDVSIVNDRIFFINSVNHIWRRYTMKIDGTRLVEGWTKYN